MDVILAIILIAVAANLIIQYVSQNFKVHSVRYLWILFGVHFLMTLAYIVTAAMSASDSVAYYNTAKQTAEWFKLFETGTNFISFVAYIPIGIMGLSYYSTMIIFSFFGFLAVLLFYLTTRENLQLKKSLFGLSFVELVFLLPNLHYWTSSLGKGSTILFGLGLFIFGLSRFNRRLIFLILGSFFIYMVRPHIFFAMVTSIMLGVLITSSGIKWYLRWLIFLLAGIMFLSLGDVVVEFAEVESMNIIGSDVLAHRVSELGKADTGVDLQNYNFFMKMFTFWFRPLFFDGLSLVGLFASFENAIYLYMFYMFFREGLLNFRYFNGWFRICLIFFLLGSVILAQVSGNLGIAMRQKAQMMPFFFIIFCKAMTYSSAYAPRMTSFLRPQRV
jgi:hypothetical protein